jgi:GT2 family glycosyltransferase
MSIAAIVIGRNEGARLIACLAALKGQVGSIIYVDSGSTDGSVEEAEKVNAQVIALDMTQPFTAARARNAGIAALPSDAELVQFLDGDCIIQPDWLEQAEGFLNAHADVAVVCGRRREIAPEASIYNQLIDDEWDTPIGQALACGGDALMRAQALRDVGGYRDDLIAGEEPELCVRLRQSGWKIWRKDVEMTRHDAQLTRFSQWWKRTKRAGHAFAEGASLHGAPPERHWVNETRRALLWGIALPLVIFVLALLITPLALLLLVIYPIQVLRLSRRGSMTWAIFSVLGKFAEGWGALGFYLGRLRGKRSALIEYK